MDRDKIGKISLDLLKGASDDTHSAEEQMREQLKDYEKNVEETASHGKKNCYGDFFLVVLTKKERLMKNVIRNYFFHRQTCPSPEWDQTVYKYDRRSGKLDFLWVIPSKDTCERMRFYPLEVDKSERLLLDFVLSFYDGSLLKIAKDFNGECVDPPLIAT